MSTRPEGRVGLFWVVEYLGAPKPIILAKPAVDAADYAGMLTIDEGHAEYWSELAQRGAAGLRTAQIPPAPIWSEYDEWPRGRVMFDLAQARYVVRADRKLHRPALLGLIVMAFGLGEQDYRVLPDEHYRSVRDVPLPKDGPRARFGDSHQQ